MWCRGVNAVRRRETRAVRLRSRAPGAWRSRFVPWGPMARALPRTWRASCPGPGALGVLPALRTWAVGARPQGLCPGLRLRRPGPGPRGHRSCPPGPGPRGRRSRPLVPGRDASTPARAAEASPSALGAKARPRRLGPCSRPPARRSP